MSENETPADPFKTVEKLLKSARDGAAQKAKEWQKTSQAADCGYQLVYRFNEDRKTIEASPAKSIADSTLADVTGITFVNLAKNLVNLGDAEAATGTAKLLLSGLQSNVANYVTDADFAPYPIFQGTLGVLKAQHAPIERRLAALHRRLEGDSEHFGNVIATVEGHLLNQANPLAMSDAAKNLRELFTEYLQSVAEDAEVKEWPHVELHNNNPTRRARLAFRAFSGTDKAEWPPQWTEQIEQRIADFLDAFSALQPLTHVQEKTATLLPTARIQLDKFVNEFLLYLDALEEADRMLKDLVRMRVENELQDLAEGDLHPQLEEGVSHAYPDLAHCAEFSIDANEADRFCFSGRCDVSCTFQAGSNGDVRRGDGATWKGTKSFDFKGSLCRANFKEVEISDVSFCDDFPDDHDEFS